MDDYQGIIKGGSSMSVGFVHRFDMIRLRKTLDWQSRQRNLLLVNRLTRFSDR